MVRGTSVETSVVTVMRQGDRGPSVRDADRKGGPRYVLPNPESAPAAEHPLHRVLSRLLSIRLPEPDIALAQRLAEAKGLPYQTYIKSLLHEALQRERVRAEGN